MHAWTRTPQLVVRRWVTQSLEEIFKVITASLLEDERRTSSVPACISRAALCSARAGSSEQGKLQFCQKRQQHGLGVEKSCILPLDVWRWEKVRLVCRAPQGTSAAWAVVYLVISASRMKQFPKAGYHQREILILLEHTGPVPPPAALSL